MAHTLSPLDEAQRAQRALVAVSELLIGNGRLDLVERDHLSTLIDLIGEHLDEALDGIERTACKPHLKSV